MKIIQLLASIDGESPGTIGSQIYGLGDDGAVWELVSPQSPRTTRDYHGKPLQFYDGATGGWKLVCQSHERTESISNPDRGVLK